VIRRRLRIPKPTSIFRRRNPPATAPGTVTSSDETKPVIIREICYNTQRLTERHIDDLEDLKIDQQPDKILWVDVVGVHNGHVIQKLGELFDLHPLTLEDVVHTHQRSKSDDYGDRIYFVVRMLHDGKRLNSEQVSLFLGPNFVISVQEREGDCFEPVRERIRQKARIRSQRADYLFYALIDAIIDGYFPQLEEYGSRLEALEDRIFKHLDEDQVSEAYEIRRDLMHIRKLLWQHRESVQSLIRVKHDLIEEETRVYLRDCHDHTIQLIDVSEAFRDQCTNLRELHLSELSARQNEVMKTLTIFATIFMPMSFVAGVYGMNFDHRVSDWNMPETEWVYGYPFALGLMAVIGVGLFVYFWRRGWLKG